jgi:hypothetical protein
MNTTLQVQPTILRPSDADRTQAIALVQASIADCKEALVEVAKELLRLQELRAALASRLIDLQAQEHILLRVDFAQQLLIRHQDELARQDRLTASMERRASKATSILAIAKSQAVGAQKAARQVIKLANGLAGFSAEDF